MDKVYLLVEENFEGSETMITAYSTIEKAKKELDSLKNQYRNYDEFQDDGNFISWFDANYNEYSTCIYIQEKKIL